MPNTKKVTYLWKIYKASSPPATTRANPTITRLRCGLGCAAPRPSAGLGTASGATGATATMHFT